MFWGAKKKQAQLQFAKVSKEFGKYFVVLEPKRFFAFGVIRSPDFAAIFTTSLDKLLSSQLQQNKAFHLTDFAQ